jgi:hypothetical protein
MTSITRDQILQEIDNFARDLEEIVSSYAEEVENTPPPPMIYHYTGDRGLRGILEAGQFWFTNIFHLNDPTELRHGLQPAIHFLEAARRSDRPEIDQFASNVSAMLKQGIEEVAHYFVCCFSAAGDDLGQWRAYADNGRGYALGFDAQILEQAFTKANAPGSGHMTFPVNYDETRLEDLHRRIVDRALPLISLPRYRNFPTGTIDDFMSELLQYLCMHVIRSALFFKHRAYSNEQEYRFFQLFRFDATVPNVRYRSRPYSLVKYREFDWRGVAPEALKSVVLGPAADPDKAFQFAADCLRYFYSGTVSISSSEIPYRAG